jgi:hypothetical protein
MHDVRNMYKQGTLLSSRKALAAFSCHPAVSSSSSRRGRRRKGVHVGEEEVLGWCRPVAAREWVLGVWALL